jgi:hypothetical protein
VETFQRYISEFNVERTPSDTLCISLGLFLFLCYLRALVEVPWHLCHVCVTCLGDLCLFDLKIFPLTTFHRMICVQLLYILCGLDSNDFVKITPPFYHSGLSVSLYVSIWLSLCCSPTHIPNPKSPNRDGYWGPCMHSHFWQDCHLTLSWHEMNAALRIVEK